MVTIYNGNIFPIDGGFLKMNPLSDMEILGRLYDGEPLDNPDLERAKKLVYWLGVELQNQKDLGF